MADTRLTGPDWGTAGDWTNSVPSTGDGAVIGDGAGDKTTGDQGGVSLNSLVLPRGYTGEFGTSAAPLKIACDSGSNPVIKHFGGGGFYIEADLNAGSAFGIDEIRIQAANRAVIAEIGSNAADAGEVTKVILTRGHTTIKANINFAAAAVIQVGFETDPANDATLIIVAGADALATLHQGAGKVFSDGAITNARISGRAEMTQDTALLTTCEIHAGAKLILQHTAATTITVFSGGTLDLMQNDRLKTITTLWRFPGSIVHMDDTLHTITNDFILGTKR